MNDLYLELQDLRKRVVRGEPVTDEELRQGILKLQQYRTGSTTTLEAAATKRGLAVATAKKKALEKEASNNLLKGLL